MKSYQLIILSSILFFNFGLSADETSNKKRKVVTMQSIEQLLSQDDKNDSQISSSKLFDEANKAIVDDNIKAIEKNARKSTLQYIKVSEAETVEPKVVDAVIENSEEELKRLLSYNKKLIKQKNRLKEDKLKLLKDLGQRIRKLKSKIKALERKDTASKLEIKRLNNKISKLNSKIEGLLKDNKNLNDKLIAQIETSKKSLVVIKNLGGLNSDLSSEKRKLLQQIDQLKLEVESKNSEYETTIRFQKEELVDQKLILDSLKEKTNDDHLIICKQQDKIKELSQQLKSSTTDATGLLQKIELLESKVAKVDSEATQDDEETEENADQNESDKEEDESEVDESEEDEDETEEEEETEEEIKEAKEEKDLLAFIRNLKGVRNYYKTYGNPFQNAFMPMQAQAPQVQYIQRTMAAPAQTQMQNNNNYLGQLALQMMYSKMLGNRTGLPMNDIYAQRGLENSFFQMKRPYSITNHYGSRFTEERGNGGYFNFQ